VTLTVADIDRWDAEAVREVFHAATARGKATLEVSHQLESLAVFDTWEGATAEARKHQNALIRQDLDAHGNEALAVGRAAGKAADGIEQVKAQLRQLRGDAVRLHMTIDALSNKIAPSSTFNGLPMEAFIAEEQLQPRLNAILTEANEVDTELATAINMADGDTPIPPGPHDNRPEIQDAAVQAAAEGSQAVSRPVEKPQPGGERRAIRTRPLDWKPCWHAVYRSRSLQPDAPGRTTAH
jgi:hypothetical protein